MAQKIPQSFLVDLLAQTNIVTLIQHRLPLKKAGDNYHCKCPFHQENSPSFSVSEKKQFFYCFGCGEHGNAIQFLMRYDRMAFRAAVESLAAQAGMPIPESSVHTSNYQAYYTLMQQCQTNYHQQLKHPDAQHFLHERGIPKDIASQYQVGYAPTGWQFIEHALQGKHTEPLITLGMLIQSQKEHQRCYDRFRERIMFPIRNERGHAIAFGGRSITQQNPKYLNSPETPIFHKRQAIYGLYEAKQHGPANHPSLVVVEGYMDVIAMASHGIRHVVATLGTAITPDHLTQLFKHTQQLVFCFDGDLAGQKASWKACELCLTLMHDGRQVSFLCLPDKEDPDSYLQAHGAKAMHNLLQEAAVPISDYFFAECANQYNIEQIAGRAAFAHAAQQIIAKCPEGIFKSLMYQKLSQIVALPAEQLKAPAQQSTPTPKRDTVRTASVSRQQTVTPPIQRAIALLLQYPHIALDFEPKAFFTGLEMPASEGWVLLETLIACIKQHPKNMSTGALLQHFHDHPRINWLATLAANDLLIPESGAKNEWIATLGTYHRQWTHRRIDQLINKSKGGGLDSEEKKQLQRLIQAKSGTNT